MRRSYVVPMKWMVIYEYEVPGGALNLNSTKLPRPWSPRWSSPSRKNPHGRTGNGTRDLMISSQKLWPLDHEAGQLHSCLSIHFASDLTVSLSVIMAQVQSRNQLSVHSVVTHTQIQKHGWLSWVRVHKVHIVSFTSTRYIFSVNMHRT
jgi:hypothetical protein